MIFRIISFLFVFFPLIIQAQVLSEIFSERLASIQDSFLVDFHEDGRNIQIVKVYEDYVLFQSLQQPIIYILKLKEKSFIKREAPIFSKAIDGFGVPNPDTFYVILEQCGEKGVHCVTIDVKNNQIIDNHFKRFNASYGAFRVINGKHYFLLSRFHWDYSLYDVAKRKLILKNKFKTIFENGVACKFEHPHGFVSFLNDSIIAFNYTGNNTIFLMNAKTGLIYTAISNPIQTLDSPFKIFHAFDKSKKLTNEIVKPFTKSYRVYSPLKTFEYENKTYFAQTTIFPNEENNNVFSHFTIWNEHFEIIHNLYMPHGRFFLDSQGNLFSYAYRETGIMLYNYGPIMQTKSLRTSK